MADEPRADRRLLEQRVEHRRGRRYVQVGDVLRDPSSGDEAVVVRVIRPRQGLLTANTRVGSAWLLWAETSRRSTRPCGSLFRLELVRVEAWPTAAQLHMVGLRKPRIGDTLRCRSTGREAVVVALTGDRAKLGWLDTGRSSWRSIASLRWLDLVREGIP